MDTIASIIDTFITKTHPIDDSLNLVCNNGKILVTNPEIQTRILGLNPDLARILIPVIVTFIIFLLGIIINLLIKKFERKSYLSSIKTVIITWSRLLSLPINQQVENCKDFSKRLLTNLNMQPEIFKFNSLLANKIMTIQLKDQIDLIILNHKGNKSENSRCLFNIISQIESLDNYEKELRNKYEIYHKETLKHLEEWNEAFKKFETLRTSLRVKYENKIQDVNYEFYSNFSKICNEFVKKYSLGTNVVNYKEELYNPILVLCLKYAVKTPNQQDVYNVLYIVQELFIIIGKWEINKKGNSELFDDIGDNIKSTFEALIEAIQKFEKMKFNYLIQIK